MKCQRADCANAATHEVRLIGGEALEVDDLPSHVCFCDEHYHVPRAFPTDNLDEMRYGVDWELQDL